MSLSRSSDIEVVGDYVYQSTYWQYSGGAADLYRCHVPTGQVEQVIGQSAKAIPAEDIAPADLDERYILGLAADNWGNLFFRADAGLYRLTQATGAVADMRVKLVLPDPAIRTVAFDRTAGELYLTRFQAFKNNAGTTRNVPVIVRVVP